MVTMPESALWGLVAWLRVLAGSLASARFGACTHDHSDGRSKILENFLPDAIPIFSADGSSVFAGRHWSPEGLSAPRGSDWPDIARIDLGKTFKPKRSRPISTPIVPDERLAGFSVALDVEEEMLICSASIRSASVGDRPAEISWFQPKTAATVQTLSAA